MKLARGRTLRRRYGRAQSLCPTGSHVQSLLFDKDRFSLAQAKGWAKRHGFAASDVDEKGSFLHLRQEDPAKFDRIRTISMGSGSGVQARVGWERC